MSSAGTGKGENERIGGHRDREQVRGGGREESKQEVSHHTLKMMDKLLRHQLPKVEANVSRIKERPKARRSPKAKAKAR